jgi:hypothetical protein
MTNAIITTMILKSKRSLLKKQFSKLSINQNENINFSIFLSNLKFYLIKNFLFFTKYKLKLIKK